MGIGRQADRQAWRGVGRRPLLLAVWTIALGATMPAHAQQQGGLRGRVDEAALTSELMARQALSGRATALSGEEPARGAPATGQAGTTYVPVSEGAVPDDPLTKTLEDETNTEDPFERAPPAQRPLRRSEAAEPETAAVAEPPDDGAEGAREALDTQTTGAVLQDSVDALDEEAARRLEPENTRIRALGSASPQAEENPYAPLGMRLGSFTLNATFDQGLLATSNVDSSVDGGDAIVSETGLRLSAVSDWSRHSARIDAYGLLRESVSGAALSEFRGGASGSLELDLAGGYAASANLGYAVRPESASSPVVIVGTASQPITHTFTGGLGIEKQAGKLRLGARGALEREVYSDADLSGGGTLSQEDRNYTLATLALRAGYEVSPALVPFVEAEIGRRFYDLEQDSGGYERSSDRYGLRAGIELDLGEKLSGELAAGWVEERFDDDRLAPISGPAISAALEWSPHRGTTVGLTGTTTVEGTTTAGDSGSIRYSALLLLSREMRANLTTDIALGAAWRDYTGSSDHDLGLSAEAGATWWFNRYAGLNGRVSHERFRSTLPDRDYETSGVYLGLKLQR